MTRELTHYRPANHRDFGLSLAVGLILVAFVAGLGWLCGVV